jgi:hypothetical protein
VTELTNIDRIVERLGARALEVPVVATRVSATGLTYQDGEEVGRVAGYRAATAEYSVGDSDLDTVRSVLLEPGLYELDKIARVPFLPGVALVFAAGEDEVVVLVDLDRRKIGFLHGERRFACDLTPESDAFGQLTDVLSRIASAWEGTR